LSVLLEVLVGSGLQAGRLPTDRRQSRDRQRQPNETIFPDREVVPHRRDQPSSLIKQRGSIMLALILNAIYRQFLKSALPGVASQGGRR
jgi:hypothetical protein